jgi:hypothetical protein
MTFTNYDSVKHQGELTTDREYQLAEELEGLFIADGEKVCMEQSNRRYSIKTKDVLRLIEQYADLPFSRILAIINFESDIWRNV